MCDYVLLYVRVKRAYDVNVKEVCGVIQFTSEPFVSYPDTHHCVMMEKE